jgi:hypothetical protein
MATTARSKRTVAPKVTTRTEASVKPAPVKASFLARAKVIVVKTTTRIVTFVKTQARKAVVIARAAIARVKPVAKRAWTVALRPYLNGVLAGVALGSLVIAAVVAPVATVLALIVSGGLFFLLARLTQQAEESASQSRFARYTLIVLEGIGQALRALAYVVSGVLAVAMCAVSLPFAVFSALMLTLGYFDVRGAGTIAFLAWCIFSGSWGFGLLWLLWRGAARLGRAPEAIDIPEYSEIRRRSETHVDVLRAKPIAIGAEEVADLVEEPSWDSMFENTQACEACGTMKGATRVRSNAVPVNTVGGPNFGQPHAPSDAMLCSDCYQAECEDNAIALTGVSLNKRSVQVSLNVVGRGLLSEVEASKKDVTKVFWAVTAWWRDRRGNHHERQWDCFHDGNVVATVVYDHSRKVYRASALGEFLATKTALGAAQRLAADTLFDEGNAVTRMVEALDVTAPLAQGA